MNTSRLLARLDAAIAAANHPVKADCLRAERAGYLARVGRLDEARQTLSSLHMQYASHPNALMSAWLALADGLLSYYSDINQMARDKMRRAYALSGAARELQLHALAAAWLSLMDFVHHDFDALGKHVADTLQFAAPDNHAALGRVSLLIGQVYHFACRFDLAQPWYVKARQHATADGDDTTQGAVIHNMAWLHANQSRQAALCGTADGGSVKQAALGAQSSLNFEALLGVTSLDALVPMLRAQVLSLQGECAQALALYEAHLGDALAQGLGRMQPNLRAEMAWCRLQLGQHDAARVDARAAIQALDDDECDIDDRAATHSRLAALYAALGDDETAEKHAQEAPLAWAQHEADQARAIATLEKALNVKHDAKPGC